MSITTRQSFLKEEILPLLATLTADTEPKFGLMTPQHMVEHLIWVTKAMGMEPAVERYAAALQQTATEISAGYFEKETAI